MSPSPSPLLVLGMHRSGTSCLAGCLEEAGLNLGEANTQAGFNKKGNRENFDFVHMHDRLLARHGAAWDRPPPQGVRSIWPDLECAVRDAAILKLRSANPTAPWGLKDPRVLLVLDGWMDLSPRFVGTFRHPAAVRKSLQTRAEAWGTQITDAHAHELWLAYNARMLALHMRAPFPVIRFDQAEADYRADLDAIGRELGLAGLADVGFRTPDLRNNDEDAAPVPQALQATWEALCALPRPRETTGGSA